MPPRSWQLRAQDILSAAERILEVTAGRTAAEFGEDVSLQESVLFNLIVIGEAARHIPEPVRQRCPDVPWLDVAGMRNVIAHGYFDVDIPIVWRTVQDDLPQLMSSLRSVLAASDASGKDA